ncbi:MAG: ABC transporter ATP-binding protein, partial [Lachnospiraceae bacterium]|nr:ABC transporter ATP-binding protein [Lachnospiraceae bacterium]
LDILGKEVLEEALKDYEGTVLFVSHDRYFIGQTAERVWDLHDGVILDYPGGYDYYEEHVEERRLRAAGSVPGQQVDASYGSDSAGTDSAGALSYEEQKRAKAAREKVRRELKACEEKIARLEERLAELNDRLNDPAIATNAGKLAEIALEQEETETQLMDEMTRWEELAQADEE